MPGEQPITHNPNGQLEPTKGCEYMNPQRFLAYVTYEFMLNKREHESNIRSFHFKSKKKNIKIQLCCAVKFCSFELSVLY